MQRIILFLLYLFFVPLCVAGEVAVKNSYSIPDGSLVEIKESRYGNYYCIDIHYGKFNNGTIYSYTVLKIYDDDTVGYMQPIFYKDSGEKVFDCLLLQSYIFNPFTGEILLVTENENETDNVTDNNNTTNIEGSVVYLNRIELYLLWILSVNAISCGVLLFLCFKGFEKV
jgi:uncharacterized membrane protein